MEGDVQVAHPLAHATQSVLFVVVLNCGKYPLGRVERQVLFRKKRPVAQVRQLVLLPGD